MKTLWLIAAIVLALACASVDHARAATELCAPFPVSGGGASNVVNPATGLVYTLDGRGCASFNDLDVPYFLTQGYTEPGSGGGSASVGQVPSPPALIAAIIPPTQTSMVVAAMAATGHSTCPLVFNKGTTTPTGIYGEVLNTASGLYWEPQYSTVPVRACEFGTVADATINSSTNAICGAFPPAVPTCTDNTVAIQAAINYAIQNQWNNVCLHDGNYWISDTLRLGWGDTFISVNLTACNNGRNGNIGNFAGVTLYSSVTDRCAINIQGARNVTIRDISLYGMNYSWAFNGMALNPWPTAPAGWLNTAITPTGTNPGGLNRYAPYAGICEDAYAGQPPSALGANAQYPFITNYPPFTQLATTAASISVASPAVVNWGATASNWLNTACNQPGVPAALTFSICPLIFTSGTLPAGFSLNTLYYVKTFLSGNTFTISATPGGAALNNTGAAATGLSASRQFGMALSSNATLRDLNVVGFAVNINWNSSPTNGQGDFLLMDRTNLANCVYCISIGNDQSRNVGIHEPQATFCYAGLTNQRFGQQSGKLGGPIDNWSGGECYEAFDIGALSSGFPLTINDFYSEAMIRFGSFAGGSVPNSIIINGCNISFGQGFGNQSTIPVAYIESNSGKISFTMNSCGFGTGPNRIDTLVHGVADVTISGGQWASGQVALPAINLPGIAVAYNYTGGILVSGTSSNYPTNSAGLVRWINPVSAQQMLAQNTIGSSQNLRAAVDFASWGNRGVYTQAVNGFFDLDLKRWWQFPAAPLNGNLSVATSTVPGVISSCDVLTFSTANANMAANSQPSNINPGDILYYTIDGTTFVVTNVGPTTGGAYPITAKQLTNMVIDITPAGKGACLTNLISDPTMAGSTTIIHAAGQNYANVLPIGASVNAGGTGYTTGALVLTATGGTGCTTQAQYNVTVNAGGSVSAVNSVAVQPVCTVNPPNPVATTPNTGGGTGATLNANPDNIRVPLKVFYGDFAASNTAVANIAQTGPTGAAATLDTYIKNGDIVWGNFSVNDPTLNWPYASGGTLFSGVTDGTPGSLTTAPAPLLSGRYPILPLPVIGFGIKTDAITRRPTPAASGGTCAAAGTQTGSQIRGTVALSGVCAAGNTVSLTFAIVAPVGWFCSMNDRTTPATLFNQTASTTTVATFTANGTSGGTDVLGYECAPY